MHIVCVQRCSRRGHDLGSVSTFSLFRGGMGAGKTLLPWVLSHNKATHKPSKRCTHILVGITSAVPKGCHVTVSLQAREHSKLPPRPSQYFTYPTSSPPTPTPDSSAHNLHATVLVQHRFHAVTLISSSGKHGKHSKAALALLLPCPYPPTPVTESSQALIPGPPHSNFTPNYVIMLISYK